MSFSEPCLPSSDGHAHELFLFNSDTCKINIFNIPEMILFKGLEFLIKSISTDGSGSIKMVPFCEIGIP